MSVPMLVSMSMPMSIPISHFPFPISHVHVHVHVHEHVHVHLHVHVHVHVHAHAHVHVHVHIHLHLHLHLRLITAAMFTTHEAQKHRDTRTQPASAAAASPKYVQFASQLPPPQRSKLRVAAPSDDERAGKKPAAISCRCASDARPTCQFATASIALARRPRRKRTRRL